MNDLRRLLKAAGVSILILGISAIPIQAVPFQEAMDAFREHSIDIENAGLARESGLLNALMLDAEDRIGGSVSLEAVPMASEETAADISVLSGTIISPDGNTRITAGMPFSIGYEGGIRNLSPMISAEHTFDWGHDDKRLSELEAERARISTERIYGESLNAAERELLTVMKSLLQNSLDMLETEESLNDLRKELDESLKLRKISEGSLQHTGSLLEIQREEGQKRLLEDEKTVLEEAYSALTGLKWDGLEDIPMPEFPMLSDEPSSLRESYLASEIAREEYLIAESEYSPLGAVLSGLVSSDLPLASGIDTDKAVSFNAGLEFMADEWTIHADGGGRWENGKGFTPELSIGFTWQADTESEQDRMRLRTLLNDSATARNDYEDRKREIREEAMDLWTSIISWQRSYDEAMNDIAYERSYLQHAYDMLEAGLWTEDEIHDTEISLRLAEAEMDILLIDGLMLSIEAKDYSL